MEIKNNNSLVGVVIGKLIKNAIIIVFADAVFNEGKIVKGMIEEISAKKN